MNIKILAITAVLVSVVTVGINYNTITVLKNRADTAEAEKVEQDQGIVVSGLTKDAVKTQTLVMYRGDVPKERKGIIKGIVRTEISAAMMEDLIQNQSELESLQGRIGYLLSLSGFDIVTVAVYQEMITINCDKTGCYNILQKSEKTVDNP